MLIASSCWPQNPRWLSCHDWRWVESPVLPNEWSLDLLTWLHRKWWEILLPSRSHLRAWWDITLLIFQCLVWTDSPTQAFGDWGIRLACLWTKSTFRVVYHIVREIFDRESVFVRESALRVGLKHFLVIACKDTLDYSQLFSGDLWCADVFQSSSLQRTRWTVLLDCVFLNLFRIKGIGIGWWYTISSSDGEKARDHVSDSKIPDIGSGLMISWNRWFSLNVADGKDISIY